MQLGAFVPMVVFVVILGGVAVRMLGLWRRTRQIPEMCLGVSLPLLGGLGIPLAAVGRLSALIDTPIGLWCNRM